MIDITKCDECLRREIPSADYWRFSKVISASEEQKGNATRNRLFWDFRYRTDSYKARKAGIKQPSVMMRYKNDRFRLYGKPEDNKLFAHCKDILRGWKRSSRAEKRALLITIKHRAP